MPRKSRLLVLLAAILCVLPAVPIHASQSLTILHVNDGHGRIAPYVDKTIDPSTPVSGAAYLAAMIKDQRAKNPEGTILLSGGDMFQGTPVSNLFHGRPVLDIMNRLKFDAMVLGNHEFDWGQEVLGQIVRAARFPVLCANIADGKGKGPPHVSPYVFLKREGLTIAVIGLITPETAYKTNRKNLEGYALADPESILPDLVRKVRAGGAQVVVILSHLGIEADRLLARVVGGIDVIVGGHSHTALVDPVRVGSTIIVQAGHNGLYLGALDLVVDEKTGRIEGSTEKNELKVVRAAPDDPFDKGVARIAASYEGRVRERLRKVVGESTIDLVRRVDRESTMGDVVTDAMRESTGAEVAIFNSGGIRADLPAGSITMEQVYTALPFDDLIVTMDLKGLDLLDLFERSLGVGGKGMLHVSGMTIEYDPAGVGQAGVVRAIVGGTTLEKGKTYRVATIDFLARGGDRFVEFERGTNVRCGRDLRDVFVAYVKRHSPLSAPSAGRITKEGPLRP